MKTYQLTEDEMFSLEELDKLDRNLSEIKQSHEELRASSDFEDKMAKFTFDRCLMHKMALSVDPDWSFEDQKKDCAKCVAETTKKLHEEYLMANRVLSKVRLQKSLL